MALSPASIVRLLFLGLAWPVLALAQNANVTVNATQVIRTVDERVFGANSVIWDPEASTPQTVGLLNAAGMRTIRVPGGSLSDEYHWRVNKTLSNTWTWSSHFGKFVDLISNLNANAMVTVNYGTGTPEEAAALVAYLNSSTGSNISIGTDSGPDVTGPNYQYNWQNSGFWASLRAASPLGTDDGMNFLRIGRANPGGAKYFEIGNECYGTWETDNVPNPNVPGTYYHNYDHDPATYAIRAAQYMTKMKAVDPTIKIGVVVVRSDENNSYKNWTPTMLGKLNQLGVTPDFVIYHSYPQAPNQESDAGLLQQAGSWAATAANIRQQLNQYLPGTGAGVEIVVTENNSVYSNPGKQSTSLVNGLYLADSIANVMKTEINGFMWWDIRNGPPPTSTTNQSASLYGWRMYGDYGMISTPFTEGATTYASDYYTPHPTYYGMKLLQYFARGGDTVVQATSGNPLLSVYAVKRLDGSLSLLVLNKDPNNTLTASVALTGHSPAATATVYSYGKPQDEAARVGSGPTDIATTTMNVAGANFTASFGPYSSTVLTINSASSGVAPAITTQPVSQTVTLGAPASFTAAASGTPVPTYQWRKEGVNIPEATSATYTIPNVTLNDAGSYSVVATNSAGSVTSSAATLAVTSAAGDFNGDGKTDLVWQNTTTGDRVLWLMDGTSHLSSGSLGTYDPAWVIATTGDFNQDGKADLVWQNTTTGECVIVLMNGTNILSTASLGTYDPAWTIAAAGDFNGDGKTDLIWQNTTTGDRAIFFMNGTSVAGTGPLGNYDPAWLIAAAGDFNQDGKTDLVWQNTTTGERVIFLMNGTAITGGVSMGIYDPHWSITGSGDFNSDGKSDLVWQNTATGELVFFLMNGTTISAGISLGSGSPVWALARSYAPRARADFNQDGKSDVVWENTTTRERVVFLMNGTSISSGVSMGIFDPAWSIAATGDFNNDGKADLVCQNAITGERRIFLMNGTKFSASYPVGTYSTQWSIAATGDFNGDGKIDLVWQNTVTGERVIFLMNGTSISMGVSIGTYSTQWSIAATGDFNGDGKTDLVWQNTVTGERVIFLMNGTSVGTGVAVGTYDPAWSIAGSGDFNNDGKPDLLWQNTTTGERVIFIMNGTSINYGASLGTYPTAWSIRN